MAGGGNAGCLVDVRADIALLGDVGCPGVEAHPNADWPPGEGVLGLPRGIEGLVGSGKSDEERVPLRVDFHAAVTADG